MSTQRLLSNRYELGETLGYGGMSEVHKGRDVRLGRDVAVKVLRADLARDPQFQTRFRREAQNAAALNHPAIVAVYDTGETQTEYGPLPYIVMEFVEGRTLRDIIKSEGPLAGKRAMEIMADVCAALDFSHRHGIVHRDVKPANAMINRAGAVKVMDFGIARAVSDGQAAVTQTSAVIGTAQYLSPEQARGESVDARSDVYAAGCVLFELITAEPPFTGDSPVAVAYQHVREDPRKPSMVNPRVSPALDAIVLKAMSKNPANRYQSSAEMRGDLVRVLSGQRPQAPMVMSDSDRTTLMGSSGATEVVQGRHRPETLSEDAEDADHARRRRAVIVTVITLLCIGVLALAAYLTTQMLGSNNGGNNGGQTTAAPPAKVAIPPVTGQLEADARKALAAVGFTNVLANYVTAPTPDQVNKVMSISPTAGTPADPAASVTITVAQAAPQVQVPDLTNKTPQEAQALLTPVGLKLDPTVNSQPVTDPNQVGKVISQNPQASTTVANGSSVSITVGKQQDQVQVPDVTGQPVDQATTTLKQNGFAVQTTSVDNTAPVNTVVAQSPAKNTKADKGATVTLSVSKGNHLTMPDLSGLTVNEAQAKLQGLGWNGTLMGQQTAVNDVRQDKRIQSQDVTAGSTVSISQTITVYVGKYSLFGGPTTR
jgi:serine/threonine-protein kinase